MSSMILLFLALAVSGSEVDDALFSGPDFASMNYVGRSYNNCGTLRKRYDQARFTFFDTGLGACGTTNSPSDFIVALNSPQYGNGEHCYEMIQISYGGKSATAQIVDECPGCPWGALDLSTGLFDYFASQDKGVIYRSWVFSGGTPTQTSWTSEANPATSSASISAPSTATATTGALEQLELAFVSIVGLIEISSHA